MKRLSRKKILCYLSLFVFIASAFTLNKNINAKAANPVISYATDKTTLAAGAYFDILVNISDVSDLYGASIDFKFDPSLMSIVSIEKGSIFDNQDANSGIISDNRSNGYISFYTMLKGSRAGISGSSSLFILKAQAQKSGTMTLQTVGDNSTLFNPGNNVRVKLSDSSATSAQISYTANPFLITIGSSEFLRYSGNDRYKTSAAISKAGWTQSDYIVIATGQDYPDALCATPLAGKYNAPILLTPKAYLDAEVEKEIDRLKPKNAFIVGGTGVVSTTVETKLRNKGINITRVAGANRFETSALVAKYLSSSPIAFIVTAYNYPDALSIASYAAYKNAPILLTAKDKLDASVNKIVFNGTIKNTYVIGGSGIITDNLLKTLPTPKRIAGANRYETNLAILNNFNFNLSNTFVATGTHFADALSGSALAGRYGAPIILINPALSDDIITKLTEKKSSVFNIYMLGGDTIVPEALVTKIFK